MSDQDQDPAAAPGLVPPRPSEQGGPRPPARTRARQKARDAMLAGVSLVWLVPIIALLATLALAWSNWSQRGDLIEVAFSDATGVTPGETVLKFREVAIGKVEAVRFNADLTKVVVGIRVNKDIAPYIDSEAQFWLVRPQISAAGISRLDTVLTGVFIEGDWDASPSPPQEGPFAGLDRAPLTRADQPGTWVILASDTAKGLHEGAPVLYRGVSVGRMENIRLSPDSDGVLADVFIAAPQDQRLTTASAFWDAGGLSVTLGTQGLGVNVGSLASLLQGGVQFDTMASGGGPVPQGHVFRLNANEDEARSSVMAGGLATEVRLTVLVDNGVRGLATGADVQFQGLKVGRVTDLKLQQAGSGADAAIRQQVTIAVQPVRLGLPPETTRDQALAFLAERVAAGLRARVESAGFLGTSLMINLVDVPGAPPATLDLAAQPLPVMPSAPGQVTDFTATAQGFVTRIGQLPLKETLQSARTMMDGITALVSSQQVRDVPAQANRTLAEAQDALAQIRGVAADLKASGAMSNAGAAVDAVQKAAGRLGDAVSGIPRAVDSIDAAATSIAAADVAGLAQSATGAAEGIRQMVAAPEAQALPGRISDAVMALEGASTDIRRVAADIRASGAAERLGPMLDSAQTAFDQVREAVADAPAMVARVEDAAAKIEEFDFAGISAEALGIVQDLRAMLGTEDAAQLPRNLSDTLQAASGLLGDLRSGNAVGSLNAALASARKAADSVATSTQRLPQVLARVEGVAAQITATASAYGDRSNFNTELLAMLRDLRRAAAAFGSLSQTIERNPRAFILGR